MMGDKPLSLKERMALYEQATGPKKPTATQHKLPRTGSLKFDRKISPVSRKLSSSSTPEGRLFSSSSAPGGRKLSSSSTPDGTATTPELLRQHSLPARHCCVSMGDDTTRGSCVVQDVVSKITTPHRTTPQRAGADTTQQIFDPNMSFRKVGKFRDISSMRCKFGEAGEPVENRVESCDVTSLPHITSEETPIMRSVEKSDTPDIVDRDSGVSCSSDDQELLSDTEFYSVDSAVYSTLSAVPRDTADAEQTPIPRAPSSPSAKSRAPLKSWSSLLDIDEEAGEENGQLAEEGSPVAEENTQLAEETKAKQNGEAEQRSDVEVGAGRGDDVSNDVSNGVSNGDTVEYEESSDGATADDENSSTENKAPFHSPFEGTINLSMSAKESITSEPPTHKGFLTIFQEESGLGAWNRRWCSVQDNKIYYWLYPEDQVNQNKEPHGEIDLRHCKTDKVAIASRLDCARPNTFVLLIETPAAPGDRNSIITETDSKVTQTKYLLSADSRQERKEWMTVLNQCLLTIVSWNTK